MARANATESQGPNEVVKGLKVIEVTYLCLLKKQNKKKNMSAFMRSADESEEGID